MFEHYLHNQGPDARRRWRIALAVNVAGFATAGMLGFGWLMDKLMIAQVAPPTANFVMVQMSMEVLPPPAAPPAAPAIKPEPEVERDIPDEDPLVPPDDIQEALPTPKPRVSKVVGTGAPDSVGTSPFGSPPGVPGIPGGIPGLPPNIGVAVRHEPKQQQDTRPPIPIETMRAQAIYAPHPDKNRLAGTRAAMFDKRPGVNETAFCVDPSGNAVDVRTVKKFPGDPAIDTICRETVKTWRFRPFMVAGRPTKTCSVQVFNISFKD